MTAVEEVEAKRVAIMQRREEWQTWYALALKHAEELDALRASPSPEPGMVKRLRALLKWPHDPRTALPPATEGFNDGVYACIRELSTREVQFR